MNNGLVKLLLSLKNASMTKNTSVILKCTTLQVNVLQKLYVEGFIQSFSFKNNFAYVNLRYSFGKSVFRNFKIVSKPSLSYSLSLRELFKLEDKKLVFFISTPKGLLTNVECKTFKIGGKLLFIC